MTVILVISKLLSFPLLPFLSINDAKSCLPTKSAILLQKLPAQLRRKRKKTQPRTPSSFIQKTHRKILLCGFIKPSTYRFCLVISIPPGLEKKIFFLFYFFFSFACQEKRLANLIANPSRLLLCILGSPVSLRHSATP